MIKNRKKVVIIGGGTAGLIIANQLKDFFNVVVVEKSKHQKYPVIFRIPLFIGLLFRKKTSKYFSKREFLMPNGRLIPFFESNLLGGASVINGCVHTIGGKSQWEPILKSFDLSYESILESNLKLYSKQNKNHKKIHLRSAYQNIIDKAFLDTLNNNNIPVGDTNFSDVESCGPILNTVKNYFRTSVLSVIDKKSFKIINGEKIKKISFDTNGKVTGVETNRSLIDADYIILSGGVIGTNDILLRTKKNFNKEKSFFSNLNIGRGVKDHTNLRVNVFTTKNIGSLNEVSNSLFKKFFFVLRYLIGMPSLMRGTGATSAAHLDLNNDGIIDTRIQIVQFTETGRHGSDGNFFSKQPGFSISITPINPSSNGEITLLGDSQIVNPKYLSSSEDIDLLKLALQYCLNLLRSKPISNYILEIMDEDIIKNNPEKYIVKNIFSGHHLIGGMHDAVDTNFKVRNTEGLYVCDASIFEKYAASNIHSSVVLISDIFSKKFIKNNFDI
tara:strand:+ start:1241 stop:2740 length:1500 start_codon:yes stop_codon:yes gene_type:complete